MPNTAQRRVIDPILSNHAQGFRHSEHVGIILFPIVPVMVSAGKVIQFGRDSFRLYNTARAPGSAAKRITFGYEGKPYSLTDHALDAAIPREHLRDANQVPGIDLSTQAVETVMRSNSLSLEKEQADIARNAANYPAANKVTLSGTDQWTDTANSDPIGDVDTGREAVRASVGIYPNTMLIGAGAFNAAKNHPNILERFKYTQRGILTPELLAPVFDVERVVVGKAVAFDDDNAAIDIWGNDVILAYVPPSPSSRNDPSYGYTYRVQNHPLVEQARWEGDTRSWIHGITDEREPQLTGIDSGYLIKDAAP